MAPKGTPSISSGAGAVDMADTAGDVARTVTLTEATIAVQAQFESQIGHLSTGFETEISLSQSGT